MRRIVKSLKKNGFSRVATRRQGGRLIEETFFDTDHVQVTISYQHTERGFK